MVATRFRVPVEPILLSCIVLAGCSSPSPLPPAEQHLAPSPVASVAAAPVANAQPSASGPAGAQPLADLIGRFKADKKALVGSQVQVRGVIYDIGTMTNGTFKAFTVNLATGKKADKAALHATCFAQVLPPGLGEGLGVDREVTVMGTVADFYGLPAIKDCVVAP